jgi:hypothetical protein
MDEASLVEFLNGRVAGRQGQIAHLAACGRCRGQLASLVELLADPGVAGALHQLEQADAPWAGRGRNAMAASLIAAVAVLAVVWPKGTEDDPSHRAPTITAATTPVPGSPRGDVAEATTLRWVAVAGVDRYRVTLFDAEGRVRFQSQTADTMAALPDSVILVPDRSYLWRVEARTEVGRWTPSDLVEFRIRRHRSP